MNYYERHLGDYIKKTAHLSLLEHGIYTRLLDVYYDREKPIPDSQVARLIGARTEPETQALQVVLQEFFELQDGAWINARCDEEIAAYQVGEPEREVKKANEDNRLKRHRLERADLFKTLVSTGKHAPWNIGMTELRALVSALQVPGPDTPPETQPATAPATPATATQTPDTRHQTPVVNTKPTALSPSKPATPHQKLVELYHELLPELPAVVVMNDGRKRALTRIWVWTFTSKLPSGEHRAKTPEEALAWFRKYFERVRNNDFLMGRLTKADGPHASWKCDLDFLLTDKGMKHVIEKTEASE